MTLLGGSVGMFNKDYPTDINSTIFYSTNRDICFYETSCHINVNYMNNFSSQYFSE